MAQLPPQHFQEPTGNPVVRWALIFGAIALAIALVVFVYVQMTTVGGVKVEEAPPTVTDLLPPPPPPPPPPPEKIEETPPEPTDEPTPTPEPTPDQPAPMQIDGPAQAGGDAYGMTSGKGGGMAPPSAAGTCIGPNCGKPAGGISDRLFNGAVQSMIQSRILGDSRVNRVPFTTEVLLWVSPEGRVTRSEIIESSGDKKRDDVIREILGDLGRVSAPPAGMQFPQRYKLRGVKGFR